MSESKFEEGTMKPVPQKSQAQDLPGWVIALCPGSKSQKLLTFSQS